MTTLLPLPHAHGGFHLAADIATISTGAGYVGASLLDYIHGIESVIIGALVVLLMILRVRSHLRRDAAERRSGRQ